MKHLEELKDSVKMELEKYGKQGLSASNFERIKGLLAMYKDACKIEMLEEESEGGYSEARGRRYAKRDSIGRYSRDGGYSEDDEYSERRMGRGYSRDEATDHLMRQLGDMMEDADPKQRETLKKWMRELERD